jgi:hypothetical protein
MYSVLPMTCCCFSAAAGKMLWVACKAQSTWVPGCTRVSIDLCVTHLPVLLVVLMAPLVMLGGFACMARVGLAPVSGSCVLKTSI